MKKKIAVLTATRSEFGLLKPLILNLMKEAAFDTEVLVTGMHLSADFGNTYREIEEAGIPIKKKIECLTKGDTPADISQTMARALIGFGDYFADNKPDLLIVLGDRYETLAVCIAAMNAEIPIAHLCGGESTEGAIDEAIRHSITKMSNIHFVSTELYRKRVIQLGEQPDRVFNVGSLCVENVINTNFLTKAELEKELNFTLTNKYGIVTFHPVTLEKNSGIEQFNELLYALEDFSDMSFIFTKANADAGGRTINKMIDEYAASHTNIVAVASLGVRKYLSAVKESAVVIGNSSSGIIEVPCLHVPTVNIGNRQKGRIIPESIVNSLPTKSDIIEKIKLAISESFKEKIDSFDNPFGNGHTSEMIVKILKDYMQSNDLLDIRKAFYDVEVSS
ncbi:MAG: UDP-N-acetylglucosamine 2-epimerase [Clostridium sp.]|nr:UDP-N-acetylglucosamine 2-epimerase [Clostridium sp.]MCM1207418.1 UDP-N-acetylglucosamine 2-epimerase [Ruminococcus sp.]